MKKASLTAILIGLLTAYALTLHLLFLTHLRDPLIHPDSAMYLTPALDKLFSRTWTLDPTRTAGYPLFLYAILMVSKGFGLILLGQHLLAIATAGMAGILFYRFFTPSIIGASLVAFFTAISPEAVLSSHAILSDTLYAALTLGGTLGFLHLHRKAHPSKFSFLVLGLAVGFALLVRPVGCALACALIAVGFWKREKRTMQFFFTAGVAFVVIGYATFNYLRYGFFGVSLKGGEQLFASMAPYIDPERIDDPVVRDALIPIFKSMGHRVTDLEWVRLDPGGPVQTLSQLYPPATANAIMEKTALDGIRHHFLAFSADQTLKFFHFFTHLFRPPDIYWQQEYIFFIYRGLDLARPLVSRYSAIRGWFHQPPDLGRYYILAFKRILQLPPAEAQNQMAALYQSEPSRYKDIILFWEPWRLFFRCYGLLGLLALGLGLAQMRNPERRFPVLCLFAVIFSYVFLIDLAGSVQGRYAIPIEPFIWILLAGGLLPDRRDEPI